MSILFEREQGTLTLLTDHTAYQMQIGPEGYLLHTYYGRACDEDFPVVFLYFFALITEESFLISSCYSLELCIQMLISFLALRPRFVFSVYLKTIWITAHLRMPLKVRKP